MTDQKNINIVFTNIIFLLKFIFSKELTSSPQISASFSCRPF